MQLRTVLVKLMAQRALHRLKSQPIEPQSYITRPTAEMRADHCADLPLAGAVNFRDLGGYRTRDGYTVKSGLLYRSGDLAALTDADLNYLLNTLHVKFVCDLRNPEEVAESAHRFPADSLGYVNLPIMRASASSDERQVGKALFSGDIAKIDAAFGQTYIGMVDNSAAAFGQALKIMTDPANLPTIFHCTAGKDRTGITAALVLSLLGVPEATISADYSLTNLAYEHVYLTAKNNRTSQATGIPIDVLAPILVPKPRWIEGVLTHIRQQYGSVEQYALTKAGLTPADIAALRANLLE